MVTTADVRKLALAFEETVELPHFERTSFRVKKKIFCTMDEKQKIAVLMLKPEEQSVFCAFDKAVFYPVNGTWGKQGATIVELNKVGKSMFKDALTEAYCNKAPVKLAGQYKQE
ncbi:MAG: MmcQ/YjbR family DNA-binding protein [Chitinophagales bacterium]